MAKEKILLLGAGELGKELTIALKRLGQFVIAVDRYAGAPAMQVADAAVVTNMLDGDALDTVVKQYTPTIIVPEIEAIRTERLLEYEARGVRVVPTARAAHLTMNRDAIRELAARKLKVRTARYAYAENVPAIHAAGALVGFPCVVKPIMSSSGKGQSVARNPAELERAWHYAVANMRGDQPRVIVEEFIYFEQELTLLTVKQHKGKTIFVAPIGHRQEQGDYRESWQPAQVRPAQLRKAQAIAKKVTDKLGGAGIFGVEFFLTKKEVIFSELSPRPHDTGMVTLISQDLSEFDLHARALLGLPIPEIRAFGPSASAVVLADRESENFEVTGLDRALAAKGVEVRVFGKPSTRPNRRMAVTLARGKNTQMARKLAIAAAKKVKIVYESR